MLKVSRKYRAQLRQQLIDRWFKRFVDLELYNEDQYQEFCRRMAGKTDLEIERIFKTES